MGNQCRVKTGQHIDYGQPVNFRFDGKSFKGYFGDTLASALLANGVHLIGRSFKYHRPRGFVAAGADEPNALVTIRRDGARVTPNLKATQVELYDGLIAESQNCWPNLTFDIGAINSLISRFIPAGFYYKTFMWPQQAWHKFYEPFIRKAAGLGVAPTEPDPDFYSQRFAHCDVLVVGAGRSGLEAALAAAEQGKSVIVCDEKSQFGGSMLSDIENSEYIKLATVKLQSHPKVKCLKRTIAFGYFPHNMVGLCERLTDHLPNLKEGDARERLWQVRAKQVVLATGALERPLVFPGNDRPGIMLAGAARTYLNRYGVLPGKNIACVVGHDDGYRAALELQQAGATIAVIADVRTKPVGRHIEQARQAGLPIRSGMTVTGTGGYLHVSSISIAPIVNGNIDASVTIRCDTVLITGGYTPCVHLFSQSRGKLAWQALQNAYLPAQSAEAQISVGSANALESDDRGVIGALPMHNKSAAFVDWQNDVTVKDIELATREGFRSIEHIKRYTTTGMATDQGKTSNINTLGILSDILQKPVPEIGLTTFRMPYTPVSFGIFAGFARGDLFDPVRTTPIHSWAIDHNAVFEDVSLWKRARYFPNNTENMDEAVARECLAVRASCGLFDASTLGKIEIVGPDAAEFLNRLYINSWSKLAVGKCRYGVLLKEDGFVMDDGVVGRLAADRFHLTTTTGGAARVLAMMEDYLQTEWQDLQVWLTSTTEQWAVIAVQGPRARDIVAPLINGIDISNTAFPHMSIAKGTINGITMRLMRVSFTGEIGYEINVPAQHGRAVWEAVYHAGQAHGITPYGTEAMHVLRAEKGFIIVGQETDGTVTPGDVGLSWAIGRTKSDYVGKRALMRAAMQVPTRKQLVGLLTLNDQALLDEGAQICATATDKPPMTLIGHVTSSYHSATLGRSIALAMVAGGQARHGETLYVPMPNGAIPVMVTAPVFYDEKGVRVNG